MTKSPAKPLDIQALYAKAKGNATVIIDRAAELEAKGWEAWLRTIFPFAFSKPFAPFHREFWDLWWDICISIRDRKPIPPEKLTIMLIWGRALAKSSSGTPSSLMKAAIVGHIYSLYLSETFTQAAEHLTNVRHLIMHENSRLVEFYPHLALDSTGAQKLGLKGKDAEGLFITKGGCIFRAFGLESSGRGIGLAGRRPDDYNVDDVDNLTHSVAVSQKITKTVTRNFLMTQDLVGSTPVTTKILQNLIIEHGFVNQVYQHKTDALNERTVIGVVNTFDNLDIDTSLDPATGQIKHIILPTSKPTWEGVSLPAAQRILNLLGLEGFMAECQNDFSMVRGGLVIPEYNEDVQIITWSEFEKVFGARRIPEHWNCMAGLDVGYSDGTHPHYSAWVFVTAAAENSPLPGYQFIYRSRSFVKTSIDDQMDAIKESLYTDQYGRVNEKIVSWNLSHEKSGELLTLNSRHGMNFQKFEQYRSNTGISQWRHLSRRDRTKPHPFREDVQDEHGLWEAGRPLLYYIVDDDQLWRAHDDNGHRLLREQVSTWELVPVKVTDTGMTEEKPSKINDDFPDAIKMLLHAFGAYAQRLTKDEKIERQLTEKGLGLDVIEQETDEQRKLRMLQVRNIENQAARAETKDKYPRVGVRNPFRR